MFKPMQQLCVASSAALITLLSGCSAEVNVDGSELNGFQGQAPESVEVSIKVKSSSSASLSSAISSALSSASASAVVSSIPVIVSQSSAVSSAPLSSSKASTAALAASSQAPLVVSSVASVSSKSSVAASVISSLISSSVSSVASISSKSSVAASVISSLISSSVSSVAAVSSKSSSVSSAVSSAISSVAFTVPPISATRLVTMSINSSGERQLVELGSLDTGATIDLSKFDVTSLNVVAQVATDINPGSVHFNLKCLSGGCVSSGNSGVIVNRYENNAIYTMASESEGLVLARNDLPTGAYELVVTPYALADMKGDVGQSKSVKFSVVGAPKSSSSSAAVVSSSVTSVSSSSSSLVASSVKSSVVSSFSSTASSVTITGSVGAGAGFTVPKASADTRKLYVSNSMGSDLNSNNCLVESKPCKTLKRGLSQMRSGFPDHLYLKRGDTWTLGNTAETLGELQSIGKLPSGRSVSEPSVISYYPPVVTPNDGLGDRPRLQSDFKPLLSVMDSDRVDFISFIGLEFYAYKMDPANPAFTGHAESAVSFFSKHTNVLFEDNKFNLMELVLQSGTDSATQAEKLTLRRNIFTGAYAPDTSFDNRYRPSNLYADGAAYLTIEDNVFDNGGWHPTVAGAAANMYNHNMYIQYDVDGKTLVVQNNIVTRASSHGIHGRPGGLFKNNFFARNAIGLQMGYTNHPLDGRNIHKDAAAYGVPNALAIAIDNVITEGHSMVKGGGHTFINGDTPCIGVGLCSGAIWGLHVDDPGTGVFVMKDNLIHSLDPNDKVKLVFNPITPVGLVKEFRNSSAFTFSGNLDWRWSNTADTGAQYVSPGRTLADYNASLGGARDFDAFMNLVNGRSVGVWDSKLTAPAINDYIRDGFKAK